MSLTKFPGGQERPLQVNTIPTLSETTSTAISLESELRPEAGATAAAPFYTCSIPTISDTASSAVVNSRVRSISDSMQA